MKRTLLVSLYALTLSLIAAPAFAKEIAAVSKVNPSNIVEITPFNLVTRSYQGYFADQGIPSNGAFNRAVRTGKVTAVDLVEKAIAQDRLSPETINDRAYISSVESHLNTLDND